jgi:hypothetical protein
VDKVTLVRGRTTLTLTLSGMYDGILRRHSGGNVDTVFVKLVVLRAWGGGAGSDVSNVNMCMTLATGRPVCD